jgi:hypothetical protein
MIILPSESENQEKIRASFRPAAAKRVKQKAPVTASETAELTPRRYF